MKLGDRAKLKEAVEHYDAGRLAEAEALSRALVKADPRDVDALQLLGLVSFLARDWERATACFKKCRRLKPREPRFALLLGKTKTFEGKLREALECYEAALAQRPGYVDAKVWKAATLERSGDVEGARAIVEGLLQKDHRSHDLAELRWRLLRSAGEHREAARVVAEALGQMGLPAPVRANLSFLLGQALEEAGEHADAFAAYSKANRLLGERFDAAAYAAGVDRVIEAFSAARLAALPRASAASELPILVVGLPRSGTTLVEQILQSHPAVRGGGELKTLVEVERGMPGVIGTKAPFPDCLAELSKAHVDALAARAAANLSEIAAGAERLVSKNVDDYKRLGIAALVLRGARVVHIRRDPLDNAVSCFVSPLPPQGQPWSTRLEHIGFAIRQYRRLMDHWRKVLDLPFFEISYEELAADPERVTRELVDFCGLAWDDACLRHHESKRFAMTLSYDQVRRPVYRSSVGRHRRFEQHLAPLREALGNEDSQ